MSAPSARRIALAWAPAVAYMALIFTLSSLVLPATPSEIPFKDKGMHFLEYAGLAFVVAHAVMLTWPRHAVWRTLATSVLITVGWGISDEIHQAFVPGRSPEALDLVADFLGAMVGAPARFGVARLMQNRQSRASGREQ